MSSTIRITSRDNQHLKFARRVRDGNEPGHLFIEGSRLCYEALNSGFKIESIFCTEQFFDSSEARVLSSIDGVRPYLLSDHLLRSIADTDAPQGIVLLAERPKGVSLTSVFSKTRDEDRIPIWIFLYETNNPSNLGAVIRTAEAAGVRAVIISEGSADPFSSKSLRASMGSAFRLPIVRGAKLEECVETASRNGITSVAVDIGGSKPYLDNDWSKPTLTLFGSEAKGLPAEVLELVEGSVQIDMGPNVESLNLAVACGIVLFEARRQGNLP